MTISNPVLLAHATNRSFGMSDMDDVTGTVGAGITSPAGADIFVAFSAPDSVTGAGANGPPSCADSQGNTYNLIFSEQEEAGFGTGLAIFHSPNSNEVGEGDTITVSWPGQTGGGVTLHAKYIVSDNGLEIDVAAVFGSADGTVAPDSGDLTTSAEATVLIGAMSYRASSADATEDPDFTNISNLGSGQSRAGILGYKVLASAGTHAYEPSWSSDNNNPWIAWLGAYKESGGAEPPAPQFPGALMMGGI